VAGTPDAVALLSWLALVSVGVGYWCAAAGVRFFPDAWVVPGVWAFPLFFAATGGGRGLPYPLHGLLAVAGLYAGGFALGRLFGRAPFSGAGVCTLLVLALSGLALQGGFPIDRPAEASWARTRPGLARAFLEVSPVVLVLESAGWDVTHAHPRLYASSGVEWFPRRPWQGRLAAPTVLVVGSLLAVLVAVVRRTPDTRSPDEEAAS
jgi:hypothetical protein